MKLFSITTGFAQKENPTDAVGGAFRQSEIRRLPESMTYADSSVN
jgi:hypothetical protein